MTTGGVNPDPSKFVVAIVVNNLPTQNSNIRSSVWPGIKENLYTNLAL